MVTYCAILIIRFFYNSNFRLCFIVSFYICAYYCQDTEEEIFRLFSLKSLITINRECHLGPSFSPPLAANSSCAYVSWFGP